SAWTGRWPSAWRGPCEEGAAVADRVRDEAAKSAGDAAKSAGDGVNESTARGIRTGTRTGSGSGAAADAGGGLLRRVRPVVGSWDAALVVALILVVAAGALTIE